MTLLLIHLQQLRNAIHTHRHTTIIDPIIYHYLYLTYQLRSVHPSQSLQLFTPQHAHTHPPELPITPAKIT